MDTYLQIAEIVLRATKRPMTAKSILKEAYKADLVPYRLYGKTQHKTLQARLSIDILNGKNKSLFFRNEPGKFFLREFINNSEIPLEYRKEVFAKRRARDLVRGPVLVAKDSELKDIFKGNSKISASKVTPYMEKGKLFAYRSSSEENIPSAAVWVFSVIIRSNKILSFRCGSYRDYRDSFARKRSVGFSAIVTEGSRDLFNMNDFGIMDCGLNAVSADLNIHDLEKLKSNRDISYEICSFFLSADRGKRCLIAVLEIEVPDWFEPINPSLSINDLRWLSSDVPPNDIEDFDPWSKDVLQSYISSRCENSCEQKTR